MVNVQINGTWHQFPKGTRMIDACFQVGAAIPHYCYHPKLSTPGNCRMCMVQMGMPPRPLPGQQPERDGAGYELIQWMPKLVISCANTVAENMGIRTEGDNIEATRNAVTEFLLLNHPLDCPICDQAGECRLQENSIAHGRGESRFLDRKVKKPKNVAIGPRVRLDAERCILCSRCIRFMDEVAGDPVLGFVQRGTHTTLTVHPGRLLDSNYSLNTVDICPVGALTSTDFRFQMRVWFLKETPSIDVNCGTGCNITIWTRENRIHRITPRRNDEVNSTWMPDSHRLHFHYLDSDARLAEPTVKAVPGGNAAAAGWPDALARAAEGLKAADPATTAIIASARMTNEELFLVGKLAAALGSPALALVPRQGEADGMLIAADRNPNTTGAKTVLGLEDPYATLPAIRDRLRAGKISSLIVLGEDLVTDAGFSAADLALPSFSLHSHLLANPTAAAATVVLPGSGFAEKRGSMINLSGRLQRLNRALTPPGQARDDWEILRDLLAALGADVSAFSTLDGVSAQLAPLLGVSRLADIPPLGLPLLETGHVIPLLEKERTR